MMGDILPPNVAVHEVFGDLPDVVLFPAEEAAIAKAVDKRRREFATARACARAALATLGVPSVPIVPGVRGAPQWPAGVVGSITHCAGFRACAAAHARDVMTIGLDAEPHDKLPDGVLGTISSPGERVRLAELTAAVPAVRWDRLLFSAKESVYKAWFPLTGRWLGFEEATIDFDPVRRTFTARLLVEGPMINGAELTGFEGRWLVSSGLVAAAIVIARGLGPHHSRAGAGKKSRSAAAISARTGAPEMTTPTIVTDVCVCPRARMRRTWFPAASNASA
jgi:4'-phosphopantetheinyl transferase EntD